MQTWQTAAVSLAGLLVGACLAVVGAIYKEPTLTNVGATIIGGALGMFVPAARPALNGLPPANGKP